MAVADDWHEGNAYAAEAERRDRDHRTLPPHATTTVVQRRRLLTGLGLAVLVLVVGFVALDRASDDAIPEARPLDDAQPGDGGLTLVWTGTDCDRVDVGRTDVDETADTVTVTLYVQVPIDGCADRGEVERAHEVTLDEPLGDRRVEDGACQLPGFRDDRRCGTGRGPGLGGPG